VGLGALISGYTAPTVTVYYDLPVKIATGVLLYLFLRRRNGLGRPEAVVLIVAYLAYLGLRLLLFPEDLPQ
jgi:cation:H+ antiporter